MADYLILDLKDVPVKIRLRPDLAPNHVERIKELAGSTPMKSSTGTFS